MKLADHYLYLMITQWYQLLHTFGSIGNTVGLITSIGIDYNYYARYWSNRFILPTN